MKKTPFYILASFIMIFSACNQAKKENINAHDNCSKSALKDSVNEIKRNSNDLSSLIRILKETSNRADSLNLNDLTETDIDGKIDSLLSLIFTNPSIQKYPLDSILRNTAFNYTLSKDNRLCIINWDENTGGSWLSNLSFFHYITESGKHKIVNNKSTQDLQIELLSYGATISEIYKLTSTKKNLYLCLGSAVGCNTCSAQIATVIELTKDSINFEYPAFSLSEIDQKYPNNKEFSSCFNLESREGNILNFQYDEKNQAISFAYLTDDQTPIGTEFKKVKGLLKFNGQRFVYKIKYKK